MANFIDEIRDRRVLPAVGVYAAGCWVLIEILDRLVERYLLSPYITDAAFWGLYSLIPAVVLVAWSHGKPGRDETTRVEKLGVPINLIATLGLLVTLFGNKDMGSTANAVTIANEEGLIETHYVPKESYRRRMAVFFFDNVSGDQENDWLQYGVTELIVQDLGQSPFVSASSPWVNYANGFYARMRVAGFDDGLGIPRSLMREIADDANRQYFVEGSIDRQDDEYMVVASVWETDTLLQVAELSESGLDLYSLVDRLTVRIRDALEVPAGDTRIAEDLPLAETYGESEEAFRNYIAALNERLFSNDIQASNDLLDQAIEADPGFVRAWFFKTFSMLDSGDLSAARAAVAKAQALDYRLSAKDQATLKQMDYRLSGQQDKLIAFLRLQTQLRGDAYWHHQLAGMLKATGQLDEAKVEYEAALEKDALNLDIYLQLSILERATGNRQAAIDYARKYLEEKPEEEAPQIVLGDLLRDSGDLEAAEAHYLQASLLGDEPVESLLRMADMAARRGDIAEARGLIEQADQAARTPLNMGKASLGAMALDARLGRLRAAIDQSYGTRELLAQSLPPFQVALYIYMPIADYHAELGETSEAKAAIEQAQLMIQPPLNQFLAFPVTYILALEGDFEGADLELAKAIELIEQFKLEDLWAQIDMTRGRVLQLQARHADAATAFTSALERVNRSVVAGNDVFMELPVLNARAGIALVHAGRLDEAASVISHGFNLDPGNPMLWLARARLQQASDQPELALASIQYALAIWKDADPEYRYFKLARQLAAEIEQTS
jgi:tetratricopeptide (TPR) repeat protein/TolB-like protein